jgi:hypothetical protein
LWGGQSPVFYRSRLGRAQPHDNGVRVRQVANFKVKGRSSSWWEEEVVVVVQPNNSILFVRCLRQFLERTGTSCALGKVHYASYK